MGAVGSGGGAIGAGPDGAGGFEGAGFVAGPEVKLEYSLGPLILNIFVLTL